MNVIPSASNTPLPSDPAQFSTAASTDSATSGADAQNFAGALSDAGREPVRQPVHKNSPTKKAQAPSSGGPLPVAGSQPPPQPQTASPAGGGSGIAAAGPAAGPAGVGTAAAGATGAAAAASPALPGQAPAQTSTPAAQPPVAPLPSSAANIDDTVPPDPTSAASQAQPPLPPAIQAAATPPPAVTQAPSALPAPVPDRTKPADSIKAAAANIAATSGRTSTNRSAAAPGASTGPLDTESAPQASLAAAAAQFTAASAADDTGAPQDDLATPDTGTVPANAAIASAPPVALPIAIAAPMKAPIAPETTVAGTAATAPIASAARGTSAQPRGNSSDAAADAAQLIANSGSSSATDTTPMPTLKVAPSVDSAEFGQGVADRVSLMMDSNLTSAKLQVNPPALGPIEVRIALQAGHAQVWFTSHSAVTRDALESGSSSLREMLGAQGFGQVSVDISQRSFQERSSQFQSYEAPPGMRATEATSASIPPTQRVTNGILDAYA